MSATMTKHRQLNVYEWMLLRGEALAAALKEDGRWDGPKADAMLAEAQSLDCPGRTKHEARKLLAAMLRRAGAGHMIKE
jgi:hypothetical protein